MLADLIESGWQADVVQVVALQQLRLQFSGALRALFETVDLLLLPVHPFGNPSLHQLDRLVRTQADVDTLMRCTAPFNLSGSPTLTLPGGANAVGLPIGFQLVGRHLEEALLVRAGHAFQQATDWHLRRPAFRLAR